MHHQNRVQQNYSRVYASHLELSSWIFVGLIEDKFFAVNGSRTEDGSAQTVKSYTVYT